VINFEKKKALFSTTEMFKFSTGYVKFVSIPSFDTAEIFQRGSAQKTVQVSV
jgi:hypothetical protein